LRYLDCHDLETTLTSIVDATGVNHDRLAGALRDYDESRFEHPSGDPWKRMPQEVLEQFGVAVDDIRFEGAYYFHGTRVLDPERFRRDGILPLDRMVEQVWPMLYELVGSERTVEQWAAFRALVEGGDCNPYGSTCEHFSHLYRLKTETYRRHMIGPYALLVREVFIDPQATWSHDYLSCPEIVQDIATCYEAVYGVDLERRFRETSTPCIVKFRHKQLEPRAIMVPFWYAFFRLRDDNLTDAVGWSFDGEGVGVPSDAITDVEVVNHWRARRR